MAPRSFKDNSIVLIKAAAIVFPSGCYAFLKGMIARAGESDCRKTKAIFYYRRYKGTLDTRQDGHAIAVDGFVNG